MPGLAVQPGKLGLVQADERGVIAAFAIELRLLIDAAVDDHVEAVTLAERRNGAANTIAENLGDLLLAGQPDGVAEICSEIGETRYCRLNAAPSRRFSFASFCCCPGDISVGKVAATLPSLTSDFSTAEVFP